MRARRRHPLLGIVIMIAIPAAIAMTVPWAFHIGGRWTPLLTWWGSGTLVTKGGASYPLFVSFHPSAAFSRLRLDGLRPMSGLQGTGCLCTAPGTAQLLKLSGTLYGGWQSTEESLISFRLLEPTILDVGQQRAGYFDLVGRWRGQDLAMDDRGAWSSRFRSGVRIERAAVTLHWGTFRDCKTACASATER